MLAFILLGGLGAILLLLSLLLDGIFDFLDGALSGTALGAGLTLYGAAGFLVLNNDGPLWLAWAVGVGIGVVTSVIIGKVSKTLIDSSEQESYEVVGLTGITTSPTSALGEVKLNHPRERNKRLAISDTEIPSGVSIVVTEVHGSTVKVSQATTLQKENIL